MAKTIAIEVVSSEKSLFSGEAALVVAPGESGELGVLPGHAPLLTRIKPGALKIVDRRRRGRSLCMFPAGCWRCCRTR